jgi:hypothetical protein
MPGGMSDWPQWFLDDINRWPILLAFPDWENCSDFYVYYVVLPQND